MFLKLLKLSLFILASFVISACSSEGSSSNKSGRGPEPALFSKSESCQKFISGLPSDYFHEWISVPEEPTNPFSVQIQVFYYGPKTLNKNVIAFYNGGPGSNSHSSYYALDRELKERHLEDKVSFIYIDQRGTGCSSGFPIKETDADILRARWYGSTGIVYDSEAIRKKILGDRKWKVFGQSFGAFVVHRYASLFPESLQAAYAHANTINMDSTDRFYSRIYSQYRVLNMYLQKYPEDRAKLTQLKSYLKLEKCFSTEHLGEICGHEIIANMVYNIGFSDQWDFMHAELTRLVPQEEPNDKAIATFISDNIDYASPEMGLSFSVITFFDRNASVGDFPVCTFIYDKLKNQGITEDQLLMNECMGTLQAKITSKDLPQIINTLNGQHDHLTLEKFKTGLLRMTPHTFFLYSGEKDTFVPKENFTEEVPALGGLLNYTHFMDSGHEGFYSEDKVWEDLVRDL